METVSCSSTSSEGDSIKIFLRVRPPDPSIGENDFAPRVLDVNAADNAIILRTKPEAKVFTYDNVADGDITQEAVFSIVGKKIIESCVAGYNGTIFAYGQTGSGKTFTMLGPSENSDSFQHELRGVIPRSFEYLFSLIAHQQELHGSKRQFLCRCSFLEIYQEQIFDLLDPASQGLHLRENMNKGVFVDGLIEQVICNPSDAYQVLILGWLNRRVAATSMNRESSRSHAVFTVMIESKEDVGGVQNVRTSQLNLVDLAGSERQKDTNTGGTRLKEAGSINKSLSVLGNVIMSLVDTSHGKKRHIPYRDSKLTFLLRDSLGGNTKTRMIACVHPDSRCFGETLSTLNFARSAKLIKNKAVVNEDFHGNNQRLQNEIRRLKEMVEVLQKSPSPVVQMGLPTAADTRALMGADSFWKKNFIEAMYFREQSESEKKTLQDVVNHLQELCNKKDKYIQSTKMIIKFREHTIQTLKQSSTGFAEVEKDELVKTLENEIKVLKQQLEVNPLLAKFSGENKHLRNELKRLRAKDTLDVVHGDSSKVAELEKIFKEVKSIKGIVGSPSAGVRSSPLKETINQEVVEKLRKENKTYHEQVQMLKHQILDVTKTAENRQLEMEVELVSRQKMITELERVLEAHQMKARIECNALKDLHCQTLKVMTTPKMNNSASASHDQTLAELTESEGGIMDCILPKDLVEGAHDALMEEIRVLQIENGKLKEKIDEFEAESLRQRQSVEKLQLYNQQLSGVLDKERAENSARKMDYTSAVNTLNEEMDTVKNDLKLLNEENTDLHLVLKSADKQLREEKENHKTIQLSLQTEMLSLETKLSKANIDLETTTREYEDALKELGSLKEELETGRLTISFLENHALELENLRLEELKKRERIDQEYKALQAASGNYNEFKEQAQASLSDKHAKLEEVMKENAEQDKKIKQQERSVEEGKEMISNLMTKLKEMKTSQSEIEASNMALKSEVENYIQELEEAKRDSESKSSQMSELENNLAELRQWFEQEMQKRDFQISNLQEDNGSLEGINGMQEDLLAANRDQLTAVEAELKEAKSRVEELKTKLSSSEHARQEAKHRYEESLKEASTSEGHGESRKKKLLTQKEAEIEQLHETCDKQRRMLGEYELSQKEKSQEILTLKAQLSELQSKGSELKRAEQDYSDLQAYVETVKASNKELTSNLRRSIKEKEEELHETQSKNARLVNNLSKLKEENTNMNKTCKEAEDQMHHYQIEVVRLQAVLDSHYEEKMDLSSKIESNIEEKSKLASELEVMRETNKQLQEENTKLTGHSNPNQKIRLMEKKNQEYNALNMKYHELMAEYSKLCQETMTTPSSKIMSLVKTPSSKTTNAPTSDGIRDITNTSKC